MSRVLAERAAGFLEPRISRRSFLTKMAMVGTALVAAPLDYVLRPLTAYAAVCGPASECASGYTVACCTVNRGLNQCPPGHFVGGWWRAAGSSYCCTNGQPGNRYIIDCHPICTCTDGCGNFCSASCIACSCRCHDDPTTCDHRRVCCNNFRYGQCHTEIACSGPVSCRVFTCVPPYQLYPGVCGTTLLSDNFTADHTAPCLAGPCA